MHDQKSGFGDGGTFVALFIVCAVFAAVVQVASGY